MTRRNYLVWLAVGIFLLSGCAAPAAVGLIAVGTAAGTAGVGTYVYVNGELKTDYYVSFDKAWEACQKTVADMRGYDVQPDKGIGEASISSVVESENVRINLKYKAKDVTTVAIRVGVMGNKTSSQLIHDRINENILKDRENSSRVRENKDAGKADKTTAE